MAWAMRATRGDMTPTCTPAEQAAPIRSAHERTSAPEEVAGRSDEGVDVSRRPPLSVDWSRRVITKRLRITPDERSMAVTASP